LPGSPGKKSDHCERENGCGYASGLLPNSNSSSRCDQEQQTSDQDSGQTRGHEQAKPADHHLHLAAPAPALDRPERQLGRTEERRRHHRCTRVDRARSQAEKNSVSRTDSEETHGQERRPTAHEGKSGNKEAHAAERGHTRNQPVAGDRRVCANGTEKRKGCKPGA
jgi:hypothetical protein